MIIRLKTAWHKLLFCMRVSSGKNLVRFIINSKRYSRSSEQGHTIPAIDPPIAYQFKLLKSTQQIFLRTYAGDIRMFYEIFLEQVYQLASDFKLQYPVIIDAGANIGLSALYFNRRFPSAKIFCLEPSAANCQVLRLNLQQLIAQQQVVVAQMAIADKEGRMGFDQTGEAFNAALNESGRETVDAISMNRLMDNYRLEKVGLLKMDIEGAEEKVFAGNLSWLDNVEAILIELHGKVREKEITRLLVERGFTLYDWNRPGSYGNVFLATRKNAEEKNSFGTRSLNQ